MNQELLALGQARKVCTTHEAALRDALADFAQSEITAERLDRLDKDERRLLDQFAYRYTRLQDDMGNRLIPSVLRALGEDVAAMPVLDRLDRLEQLGWLDSADEWGDLRRIRNEFTHEYPETPWQRWERLELARSSAFRLCEIFQGFSQQIVRRWGKS